MEGPALSPSYTILKYNALLRAVSAQRQRRLPGRDRLEAAQRHKISFEMQANHYKSDTFFTLDPNGFMVQEADGTPAYLGNFTSFAPYGISVSAACNTTSMGTGYTSATNYTILSPANKPGGLPIINPACAVVTSYSARAHPHLDADRNPALQSTAASKNISMNGNVHYTRGTSDMPNYYESAQGLTHWHVEWHCQSLGDLDGRPCQRRSRP